MLLTDTNSKNQKTINTLNTNNTCSSNYNYTTNTTLLNENNQYSENFNSGLLFNTKSSFSTRIKKEFSFKLPKIQNIMLNSKKKLSALEELKNFYPYIGENDIKEALVKCNNDVSATKMFLIDYDNLSSCNNISKIQNYGSVNNSTKMIVDDSNLIANCDTEFTRINNNNYDYFFNNIKNNDNESIEKKKEITTILDKLMTKKKLKRTAGQLENKVNNYTNKYSNNISSNNILSNTIDNNKEPSILNIEANNKIDNTDNDYFNPNSSSYSDKMIIERKESSNSDENLINIEETHKSTDNNEKIENNSMDIILPTPLIESNKDNNINLAKQNPINDSYLNSLLKNISSIKIKRRNEKESFITNSEKSKVTEIINQLNTIKSKNKGIEYLSIAAERLNDTRSISSSKLENEFKSLLENYIKCKKCI